MNASAWRRDLFKPDIAHLPEPDARPRVLERRQLRVQDTVCGRLLRVESTEGDDTMRCPDCAAWDVERGEDQSGDRAAGGPASSAR